MAKDSSVILDECINRLKNGESIDAIIADYPEQRSEIEPLLRLATQISSLPAIQPSEDFVKTTEMHLLRQINQRSGFEPVRGRNGKRSIIDQIGENLTGLRSFFTTKRRVAVTVSLALVLALIVSTGQFIFTEPDTTSAATGFLRILSGTVQIYDTDTDATRAAEDGMSVDMHEQVITGEDAHALITFFDGSTIKLEPNTTIEIEQVGYSDNASTFIILKQWLGRTWCRVEKLIDSGSRFEIETPSATAAVRGTLFTTDVSESGTTTVQTTEGLVSVSAMGGEVFVAPDQQTDVNAGNQPANPEKQPDPETEMVILIKGAAAGSVTDPTGSSTGAFPDGQAFNQISGSQTSIDEDTQILRLIDPEKGKFILALRDVTADSVSYTIQFKTNGVVTSFYSGSLGNTVEDGYLIDFSLRPSEDGLSINGVKVKLLDDENPEKITDTKEFTIEKPDRGNNNSEDTTPPGQEKKDDSSSGQSGQDDTGDDSSTPPGQEKKEDSSSDQSGQGNSEDDSFTPPGQEKKDDSSSNQSGQDDNEDDTFTPPGQEKKDDSSSGQSGQGNNEDDSSTPPGQEKKDDSSSSQSGQGNSEDDSSTPPGQEKKDDSSSNQSGQGNTGDDASSAPLGQLNKEDTLSGQEVTDEDTASSTPPGQAKKADENKSLPPGQNKDTGLADNVSSKNGDKKGKFSGDSG